MTHASIYAQQLTLEFDHMRREVHGILAITRLLLTFNYHLLTRHFLTPTAIYYTSSYGDKSAFQTARQNAKALASTFRQSFGRDGKQFLRECCARWRLKPVKHGQPTDLAAASSGRTRAAEAGG
jgi:hypothetical protein